VCPDGFNAAILNVSSSGGGTVHARGPGVYTVAGVEMRSHGACSLTPDERVGIRTAHVHVHLEV
jgi:hypothetical protein